MSALGLWAIVSTDLDNTLEVNVHGVGELESLEVGEAHDRGRRSKVFNFLEFTHNLWSYNASMLIDKLNRSTFSIMRHAVSYQHVEFVLVVFDGQNHCHCLSDLDDSTDFRSPRSLAYLNLHPALEIVSQEVGSHSVKHVNLEWTERYSFLVEVVPRATQFTSLQNDKISKDC